MRVFSDLYVALDQTTKTNEKLRALRDYFSTAPPADAAWAVYFLIGRRPKRLVSAGRLREWAAEEAGVPLWLFAECYEVVGDLAETIALLLREGDSGVQISLHRLIEQKLLPLRGLSEPDQKNGVLKLWRKLNTRQLFVVNKLITGAFRVGVSRSLVTRALSQFSGLETAVVAHRLAGDWQPSETFFSRLLSGEVQDVQISRPYPFFLASPLQEQPVELGSLEQWQVEWKWDGIRAQLIRRRGEVFLWSRGEELITEQFPELSESALAIDDGTVLDGEILPWQQGKVMPFSALQRRLGRKRLSRKILSEVPVVLLSFDLLEYQGKDIRGWPLRKRRHRLEQLLANVQGSLMVSPVVEISSWQELARRKDTSREWGVEGLMLKDRDSAYLVGRKRGHWWKWKVDPYTVDAVLIYAQRGHGKRATLYTDYTFAVWDEGRLTPFAKAYSGLSDLEIREVDRFVRNNTLDRFGPVRAVRPELVFEIAFDGIRRSRRHKSGLAVRFPRMARWRRDKRAQDADRIESVQELLPEE